MDVTRRAPARIATRVVTKKYVKAMAKPWVLAVGLGILLAFLGIQYHTTSSRHADLEQRLQESTTVLKRPELDMPGLTQKLEVAESSLAATRQELAKKPVDTEVGRHLQALAQSSGVVLSSLEPQKATTEKRGETMYLVSNFIVRVRGELANLVDFTSRLESGAVPGLQVFQSTAQTLRERGHLEEAAEEDILLEEAAKEDILLVGFYSLSPENTAQVAKDQEKPKAGTTSAKNAPAGAKPSQPTKAENGN